METLTECPVCQGNELMLFNHCTDHSISKETFSISQCKNCGFLFTNPRPELPEIGKYYQSEEYISHSDSNKGIMNKLYHLVRSITLKSKLSLINKVAANKGEILDIGCGTGYFLEKCKKNGWKVKGTEPDKLARKIAEENTKELIRESINEIDKQEKFDVITLWHVLEHIHELNEDLKKIISQLKEKGHLIIAVPNPESYDCKHYGMYWAAWDVPRHLYHFTPSTIEKLMLKHGVKIVATKPMKFDSYYVSMLSEKYRNGSNGLLNGVITGFLSNLKAKNNSTSSIIYICEKQ